MGLKAHVKINVSIHLEDETGPDPVTSKDAARLNEIIKYPLAVNHAGVIGVTDKDEAERVIVMLGNHINTTFKQMGILRVEGTHKPTLEAAFGGDPEKLAS